MTASRIGRVDFARGNGIIFLVILNLACRVGAEGFASQAADFVQPFRMLDLLLMPGLFLNWSLFGPVNEYLDLKAIHFTCFYGLWLSIQPMAFETSVLINAPMEFVKPWLAALVKPAGKLWFVRMLLVLYAATWLLRRVPAGLVLVVASPLQSAARPGMYTPLQALSMGPARAKLRYARARSTAAPA